MNNSKTTLQTVYVVETYFGARIPLTQQYKAISVGATGAKVLIRGSTKFIPIASNRKFFVDQNELINYVRSYMSREVKLAEGVINELSAYINDETNEKLLSTVKLVPYEQPPAFKVKLEDL